MKDIGFDVVEMKNMKIMTRKMNMKVKLYEEEVLVHQDPSDEAGPSSIDARSRSTRVEQLPSYSEGKHAEAEEEESSDEDMSMTGDDQFVDPDHLNHRKISKESIERRVPLFGNVLSELKSYLASAAVEEDNLFPRYCGKRQTNNVSAVLNNKHLDVIDKDPRLKMHGLRDTLSAKFMATSVTNDLSGYLIGWHNNTTVGMQKEYQS